MKRLLKYRLTKMASVGGTIIGLAGATTAVAAVTSDLGLKETIAITVAGSLVAGSGALINIKGTDKLAELYSEMDTAERAASKTMDYFDYALVNEVMSD